MMTFNSSASLLEGRCALFFQRSCSFVPVPTLVLLASSAPTDLRQKRTFFFLAKLAGNNVGSFSPLSPMSGGGLSNASLCSDADLFPTPIPWCTFDSTWRRQWVPPPDASPSCIDLINKNKSGQREQREQREQKEEKEEKEEK